MAVGTVRTIVRSVTVPANGVAAFSQPASALPAPHAVRGADVADPNVDLVSFTVNGLHSRLVQPSDRVCAIFANGTGAPITTNVTVTLVELGGEPPL